MAVNIEQLKAMQGLKARDELVQVPNGWTVLEWGTHKDGTPIVYFKAYPEDITIGLFADKLTVKPATRPDGSTFEVWYAPAWYIQKQLEYAKNPKKK